MSALRLPFADIEAAGPGGCEPPHLSAFIAFHAEYRDRRLLIHCTAGLSRSPAYAILALMLDGMTIGDSCALVAAAVPEASPNRRVLWHAETLLNLTRGAIVHEAVRTFAYRHGAHGAAGARTGPRRRRRWFRFIRDNAGWEHDRRSRRARCGEAPFLQV